MSFTKRRRPSLFLSIKYSCTFVPFLLLINVSMLGNSLPLTDPSNNYLEPTNIENISSDDLLKTLEHLARAGNMRKSAGQLGNAMQNNNFDYAQPEREVINQQTDQHSGQTQQKTVDLVDGEKAEQQYPSMQAMQQPEEQEDEIFQLESSARPEEGGEADENGINSSVGMPGNSLELPSSRMLQTGEAVKPSNNIKNKEKETNKKFKLQKDSSFSPVSKLTDVKVKNNNKNFIFETNKRFKREVKYSEKEREKGENEPSEDEEQSEQPKEQQNDPTADRNPDEESTLPEDELQGGEPDQENNLDEGEKTAVAEPNDQQTGGIGQEKGENQAEAEEPETDYKNEDGDTPDGKTNEEDNKNKPESKTDTEGSDIINNEEDKQENGEDGDGNNVSEMDSSKDNDNQGDHSKNKDKKEPEKSDGEDSENKNNEKTEQSLENQEDVNQNDADKNKESDNENNNQETTTVPSENNEDEDKENDADKVKQPDDKDNDDADSTTPVPSENNEDEDKENDAGKVKQPNDKDNDDADSTTTVPSENNEDKENTENLAKIKNLGKKVSENSEEEGGGKTKEVKNALEEDNDYNRDNKNSLVGKNKAEDKKTVKDQRDKINEKRQSTKKGAKKVIDSEEKREYKGLGKENDKDKKENVGEEDRSSFEPEQPKDITDEKENHGIKIKPRKGNNIIPKVSENNKSSIPKPNHTTEEKAEEEQENSNPQIGNGHPSSLPKEEDLPEPDNSISNGHNGIHGIGGLAGIDQTGQDVQQPQENGVDEPEAEQLTTPQTELVTQSQEGQKISEEEPVTTTPPNPVTTTPILPATSLPASGPAAEQQLNEGGKTENCSGKEGTWSEWKNVGMCSAECGACGVVQKIRECLSYKNGNGCPCNGEYKVTEACNIGVCEYPQPSCCSPYNLIYLENKFACGPQSKEIEQKFIASFKSNSAEAMELKHHPKLRERVMQTFFF